MLTAYSIFPSFLLYFSKISPTHLKKLLNFSLINNPNLQNLALFKVLSNFFAIYFSCILYFNFSFEEKKSVVSKEVAKKCTGRSHTLFSHCPTTLTSYTTVLQHENQEIYIAAICRACMDFSSYVCTHLCVCMHSFVYVALWDFTLSCLALPLPQSRYSIIQSPQHTFVFLFYHDIHPLQILASINLLSILIIMVFHKLYINRINLYVSFWDWLSRLKIHPSCCMYE